MPFPQKFKQLLEKTEQDVDPFNEVWVTWAVCGCEENACGWEGWVLEAVIHREPDGTKVVRGSDSDQICPQCGLLLFRTEVTFKLEKSDDQNRDLTPGVDYESSPIEYMDDL